MFQVASHIAHSQTQPLAPNFRGQVRHFKEVRVQGLGISRRRLLARGHGLAEERAQEVEEAGNQDRDVHQVDILGFGVYHVLTRKQGNSKAQRGKAHSIACRTGTRNNSFFRSIQKQPQVHDFRRIPRKPPLSLLPGIRDVQIEGKAAPKLHLPWEKQASFCFGLGLCTQICRTADP